MRIELLNVECEFQVPVVFGRRNVYVTTVDTAASTSDMNNIAFRLCAMGYQSVVPTSPEYRKAVIACEKLMEQLSQRLSKEDYELVQELRAQTAIAQCEESESHFKYGFSAGLMFSRKPMNKCSRRKKNR